MAVGVGSNPGWLIDAVVPFGPVATSRQLSSWLTSALMMPVPRPGVVACACLPMPLSETAKHQASPDRS